MSKKESTETVAFTSQGIACRAYVVFVECGLTLGSCHVSLGSSPQTIIKDLPEAKARVVVDLGPGSISFDTSKDSAVQIQTLFKMGAVLTTAEK